MVYILDDEIIGFPDPRECEPERDGLFAIGGDLSFERLVVAYRNGIFPWFAFRGEDLDLPDIFYNEDGSPRIQWFCPMKRFVIFPDEIHISHSMRQLIRKGEHKISIDRAFDDVIHNCSELRIDQCGAWLGPQMIEAYTNLHREGVCHSVEVWNSKNELIGGLYGVMINRAFIGESMFSLEPSGSKLALIFLANYMRMHGGTMIDCQLETPHLRSMGGRYISYDEYLKLV